MELSKSVVRQKESERKAKYLALLFLFIILLFLYIPMFSYRFPPPELQGVIVAFGDREGNGDRQSNTVSENVKTEKESIEKDNSSARIINQKSKIIPKTETQDNLSKSNISSEAKSKNDSNKSNTEKNKKNEIAEQKNTSVKDKLSEQKNKLKQEYDAMFDQSKGENKGNSDEGDPDGKPDEEKLKALSKGHASYNLGLTERGLLYEPEIIDNSQKAGKVVIEVCVEKSGKVFKSNYTQLGSTTTDLTLITIAEEAASKYIFSPSDIEEQCGKISIDFKLE